MRFPRWSFAALALLVSLAAPMANDVVAEEYTVSIKGKSFAPEALRIRPGDTIRFVNDDSVSHDIYSLTRGHFFTSGRRAPGKHAVFVFNRPGAFDVISAAEYDNMRLNVVVAER